MIVITGSLPTRPDARDQVIAAAAAMAAETRKEAGCHGYTFAFDVEDAALVHVIEQWEDEAALAAHMASPHMAAFGGQLAEIVAGAPQFTKFTNAEPGPLFPG